MTLLHKKYPLFLLLALINTIFLHALSKKQITDLFNQAVTYLKQKKYVQSLPLFKKIIDTHPDISAARYNYAHTLKTLQKMPEAIKQYTIILQQEPDNIHAHIGLAQAHLALGNLKHGFEHLEWRLGKQHQYILDARTFLAHHNNLTDKKILLCEEWGVGDTVQMLRYVRELKKRGAYIMIQAWHKNIGPLLLSQPYVDHVILPQEPILPYHIKIPMVSLPFVFQTIQKTIPADIPYLFAQPKLVEKWQHYSTDEKKINIGICWQGNTIHDPNKYMPLYYFAQLTDIPNVKIYSLQKEHGLDQLTKNIQQKIKIVPETFDTQHGSFMDTLALMQNLDLIITVDTSIAHIAGALGKKTFLVLP